MVMLLIFDCWRGVKLDHYMCWKQTCHREFIAGRHGNQAVNWPMCI